RCESQHAGIAQQLSDRALTSMMNDFRQQYPGKSRKELLSVAGMLASSIVAGKFDEATGDNQTMIA
ncbi:hypothetical protein, partial [Novosphingobium sp. AAP83]|uniref:hypothetical protein n=1 Tax=Novosphingobium sp. AAP83 TaxID=1523425 RepID=UPI001E48698E